MEWSTLEIRNCNRKSIDIIVLGSRRGDRYREREREDIQSRSRRYLCDTGSLALHMRSSSNAHVWLVYLASLAQCSSFGKNNLHVYRTMVGDSSRQVLFSIPSSPVSFWSVVLGSTWIAKAPSLGRWLVGGFSHGSFYASGCWSIQGPIAHCSLNRFSLTSPAYVPTTFQTQRIRGARREQQSIA